jgi:hypothetical protein
MWASLLPPTQNQWRLIAAATPFLDSLNNPYFISGFNLFVKTNLSRLRSGLPVTPTWGPTPPTPFNPITSLVFSTWPCRLLVTVSEPPAVMGWNYRFMAAPFQSSGLAPVYPDRFVWIREFFSRSVINEDFTIYFEDKLGELPSYSGPPGSAPVCHFAIVLINRNNGLPTFVNQIASTFV